MAEIVVPNPQEALKHWSTADPKAAAEVAYVIAVLAEQRGDIGGARRFARLAHRLLMNVEVSTLEDAAPRFLSINGVLLPNYFHEGVLRQGLGHLLD